MPTAEKPIKENTTDKSTAVTPAGIMRDKKRNEPITKLTTSKTEKDYNKQQSEQEQ